MFAKTFLGKMYLSTFCGKDNCIYDVCCGPLLA